MRRLVPILAVLGCLLAAAPAGAAVDTKRPNILVVMTDDQRLSEMTSLPLTRELVGRRGTTFDNAVVSLSQCCPSRATFLTGQYAHNHGVRSAAPPFGAVDAFDDSETLAVWLERAGYDTALVGKYMNGYGRRPGGRGAEEIPALSSRYIPPGWTDWHGLLGPTQYNYFVFQINNEGKVTRYGQPYQSDVLTGISEGFIRKSAQSDKPFFLWTTYVAPHLGGPHGILDVPRPEPPVPSPLFGISFLGALMPITPAYNEADVSDKPQRLQSRPPIRTPTLRGIAEEWRQRQRSLQSVDIGVKRLVDSLRETGQLENTIIVFTSDNGYMNGEHRITGGKVQPYEPSIRVPLLMRGPGVPAGERREQLVWNGDLAPTILEAAGARASWVPDGESLWPVVRDADAPGDDAVLLEGPPRGTASAAPRFIGVRTERYTWIEHVDGIPELYDLRRDPFQLRNMARTPEGKRIGRILSRRVARLRDCSGATCR